MRYILLIVLCALVGVFACIDREPVAPGEITFDRYSTDNEFIMNSTAWYCTTSAQFVAAVRSHSDGDVIYLTSDDITYSVNDYLGSHNIYFFGDLIGLDTNPSKVSVSIWNSFYSRYDLTHITAWSVGGGVSHQFTNIENDNTHYIVANSDTLYIDECGTDESFVGLFCAHTNSCIDAENMLDPIRYLSG